MKRKNIKNLIIKKKKIIILATVIAVLGGGIILVKTRLNKNLQLTNINEFDNTVTLEKGDINQSIIVTGTVKSGEVSNVSTVINAKVKQVDVKVGDIVKVGDVIAVLDDTDIKKEIEAKTKEIAEQIKALNDNRSKLTNQLNTLKSTQSESSTIQNNAVQAANSKLNEANNALNNYQSTYNTVKSTYDVMISGIKGKQDSYDNATKYKDQCYEAWIKSGGRTDSQEYNKYIDASNALDTKKQELESAKTLYDYDNINDKYTEVLAIYQEKVATRDAAKSQYDEAVANNKASANSNKSEVDSVQASIDEVNTQLQKLNNNEELKELNEKLDKTVLKAETAGKITELKVNVGSMVEGAVATIQSTDNLILEVSIPDYDIQKVSAGMKVKINSDTLSEKVEGELLRISPVAGSEDKKGFSAEILIKNPSGLFIGTSAKAEIIISGKENVILAPIDAIKDIDTNPVVLLQEANGEFKEVPVTIGEKNDYYVEISGSNISEGKKISGDAGYYSIPENEDANLDAGGGMYGDF